MDVDNLKIAKDFEDKVNEWLTSTTRSGRISRNTVAIGLVILDWLAQHCPVFPKDIISDGGEIKGSRSGLPELLARYDIPRNYLKEATTRQGHQDGQKLLSLLDYGRSLCDLSSDQRKDVLAPSVQLLLDEAERWFRRQHLKVRCNRLASPLAWIQHILQQSAGRSGGLVEQHLVGAKLQRRFPNEKVQNLPGHAGDAQTGRPADFTVGTTAYHVTAAPAPALIDKCEANIDSGFHPVILVPRVKLQAAQVHAETKKLQNQITIMAIEDFVSINVIELSSGRQDDFLPILRSILDLYNQRLAEVETDLSLRIEIE